MNTYAFIKPLTRNNVGVAPLTPTLITVLGSKWCTVVTGSNDPIVHHNDCSYSSLHTVGSGRCHMCNPHKISIPLWSKIFVISKINGLDIFVKLLDIRMVVHNSNHMLVDMTFVEQELEVMVGLDEGGEIIDGVLFLGSLKSDER
jgi:hypothetical protein